MKDGIISCWLVAEDDIKPETADGPCPPPCDINLEFPPLEVFIMGILACSLIVGYYPIYNLLERLTPDGPLSPIPPPRF